MSDSTSIRDCRTARLSCLVSFLLAVSTVPTAAAPPSRVSEALRPYVSVDAPVVALAGVKLFDGTGSPARSGQVLVIEHGRIVDLGSKESVSIPERARILDLSGRTVIPGLVGTHNHLHMPGMRLLAYTAPRLYLASGVTTIQTTGSASPREEAALARAVERGEVPGPQIVHTGPYFTGPGGSTAMLQPKHAAEIEREIRRWAGEGVRWFKVYRHIEPARLRDVIRIAHEHDVKVAGHLCSVTYAEAAEMGIDVIEHGFLHAFDLAEDKETGRCSGSRSFRDAVAIDSKAVRQLQASMIEHGVALSSTLAIFEAQVPSRAIADRRTLEAMSPEWRSAYERRRQRMKTEGDSWTFKEAWLKKSMQFDRAFHQSGGLLTAGLDPGLHNLPGFGDQRNFELFVEAGFSVAEAIQVMTSNGAKLLELPDRGVLDKGRRADLVVLRGDLEADSSAIRAVELIFKAGVGYQPEKLLADVEGQVGLR
ncbi:MAG: amidohydrolase family protein [Thermoanaerobaculia bacterium]|nr:amidohydrolase family protein [Thermoanaerobaculia bacterium]